MELLEASKHFYVKSEAVLDTKQELKNSQHLFIKTEIQPSFGLLLNKSSSFRNNGGQTTPVDTSPPHYSTSPPKTSTATAPVVSASSPACPRQSLKPNAAYFVHNPTFRYIARGEASQPSQKHTQSAAAAPPPLPPKSPLCPKVASSLANNNVVVVPGKSLSPPPPPLPPKKPQQTVHVMIVL